MTTERALQHEWHELVRRIDELHVEASKLVDDQDGSRIFAIRQEDKACRRRIAEIAATGVAFDQESLNA